MVSAARHAMGWVGERVGDPLTGPAGARLASVLFVLCGALVSASTLLPSPPGASRTGLAAIGALAVAAGLGFWLLPWERWSRSASLFVEVPVAFTLVVAHNWLTAGDGFRYGLFFLVIFAWLGLAHPPGMSLRLAPVLVLAYAAPLVRYHDEPAALASLFYAVPICVLVGETAAAVAGRLRASETALRSSEQRWRSLVLHASDLIVVLDREGVIQYATPAAGRLFGYPEDGTTGIRVLDLIHPDDLAFVLDRLALTLDRPGPGEIIEFRVAKTDGSFVWVESIGTNLLDEPSVEGIVCNVRDITERKEAERVLLHRARHDSLTDLPNRHHLLETVADRVGRAQPFALLLLDLDRFKEINDALGHATGDRVLVEVGRRLTEVARVDDVVARLGGDEFAIVVGDVDGDIQAGVVADRLLGVFEAPFEIDGMGLHVGASIGIAVNHASGADENVTLLLQQADVAMYRAKGSGSGWSAFGPADQQNRPARLAMVGDLRDAIDAGEVEAHYQPQIDLSTGLVRQVEVLSRWTRDGVAVRPDEFIALAEHTGLIDKLTWSVLRQSLAQVRRWADVGLPVAVAVNVSALTLRAPNFVASVRAALDEAGVASSSLTLEITESALADHTEAAVAVMRELRDAGIRLSIDDFGSGYSSMAYLKRLPIDELKIDRAFVTDMLTDPRDQPITRTIIELAHSLGLEVVGEGVESPALEQLLRTFGCDAAQGYGICRPVPADELTGWLSERATASVAPTARRLQAL